MAQHKQKKRALPLITCIAVAAVFLSIFSAYAFQDPGEGNHPPQEITATDSCMTCGMFPAHFPEWQSQVIFQDGFMASFDGCKCMFRYLLNMQKFDQSHSADQVAAIWVKDHATNEWTDGKIATYVVGSSKMGPMGKELIPFAAPESANAFQKENGGAIESYSGITMATIKPLMGPMGMHKKMQGM